MIVIGSGASGGMAAWNLTRQGVDVLMLDAGTRFSRSKFWTHVKPGSGMRGSIKGIFLRSFISIQRSSRSIRRRGSRSIWCGFGGAGARLTFGVGWRCDIPMWILRGLRKMVGRFPGRYGISDIKPYYDQVDQFIGVCGGTDDQDSLPGSPYMLPAASPRCGERLMQKAAKSIGVSIVAGRRAVFTQAHNGHAKCHFCGSCGRGMRCWGIF